MEFIRTGMSFCALLFLLYIEVLCVDAQSTDGTFFMVAFPPTKRDVQVGRCQIVIDSKYTFARVTIGRSVNTQTYTVSPYQSLRYTQGCGLRTTEGVENNRAYFISSDYPITVKVLNEADNTFSDVGEAQPVDAESTRFYLANAANNNQGDCGPLASRVFSYFVVMAQEDDTQVDIVNVDGSSQNPIYLNAYQTYTQRRLNAQRGVSFTRVKISSTKPIAVITGNACFSAGNNAIASPTFDFVPPVSQLGTDYVIAPMPIPYSNQQQFIVTIVATEQLTARLTDVTDPFILNERESFQRNYRADTPVIVRCDKRCLVAVTTQNYGPSFTTFLPPTSAFNEEIYYTEPTRASTEALELTIIISTISASFDDFFVDGTSIGNLGWQCSNDDELGYAFCYVEYAVTENKHYNISTSGPEFTFSALLFAGTQETEGDEYFGKGYGHQLGFGSLPGDPVPPPEIEVPVVPFYEVYHEGNFTTEEPLEASCQLDYGAAFKTRATDLITEVNGLIGGDICADVTSNDVRVVSVSTVLGTDESTQYGITNLQWTVGTPVNGLASLEATETCAGDISAWLSSYDNWGLPILPPIDGCAEITFEGDSFTSLQESWNCGGDSSFESDGPVRYTDRIQIEVLFDGFFQSDNGQVIGGGCSNQFRDAFNATTYDLVADINDLLENNGGLCSNDTGITVEQTSITWFFLGSRGASTQLITVDPPGDLPIAEVQDCVTFISDFIEDQASWNQPILPDIIGCPITSFIPDSFQERERNYLCL